MTPRKTLPLIVVLVLGATTGISACAGDSSGDRSTGDATTLANAAPVITVTNQWARTNPSATTMGAAYMTIEASADDELTGVAVDRAVAMSAELHETMMVSDDTAMGGMSETTMPAGAMTMQKVDAIPVKAGVPLELKIGGYHIMLMGLAKPLELGKSLTLTLSFSRADDVIVSVPVLDDEPM